MKESSFHDEKQKVNFKTWKYILKIVFKSKKRLSLLIFFALSLSLLDVIVPILNKYAIDYFFIAGDYTYLTLYIVVNVIIAILFGFTIWGFVKQAGLIEAETSYELRKQAFENIQKLSFSYFDKTPQGWVMARVTSDASRLSNIISWGIVDFVSAFSMMIFIVTVLFIYHFVLALIVLFTVPLLTWIAYVFRKRILKYHREARRYNSELTAQYSESFLGAKTSKSLNIEKQNLMNFEATAKKMKSSSLRAVTNSALFSSIILALSYISVAIIMFFGSKLYLEDIHIFGLVFGFTTLQLFITYTMDFFRPVMELSSFLSEFQNAQASAERIVQLITEKPDLVDTDEVVEKYGSLFNSKEENYEEIIGKIEFKNVEFYYNKDEVILNNFNLTFEEGKSTALVGRTGSGKTTIVNLLSRFYEPTQGEILIDDVNYKERSFHWLHKRLGYVLQSPQLFNDSIKNNIKYGKLNATDEEVIEAAKEVGAHDFISQLKNGYDTNVGEGGSSLSIGQKQLISFARALIRKPSILVLDEATSSIDSESEQVIQLATKKLLVNKTAIIVAHRLSTIVDVDKIIFLDEGKIIESGSHDELIALKGHYYDLYKQQFFEEKENIKI